MPLDDIYSFFLAEIARANDYYLYHTAHSSTAYKILKSNSLKLPLAETNTSESKFKGKMFYLSFARTPASGYIADRASGMRQINQPVLFVFNQKKLLAQRGVTIKPVDYWGANASGRVMGGGAKEAEERLFSDHPVLDNIRDSIVEIRIATDFDKYTNNEWLLEIIIACKKFKIPVKLFKTTNKQGYLLGKENAEESKEILTHLKSLGLSKHKNDDYTGASRAKIIKKKIPNWGSNNWLTSLTELVHKDDRKSLTTATRRKLWYYLEDLNSFKNSFSSDVHNLRSGHDLDKKAFYSLIKKMKAKSVDDFFSKVFNKWKDMKE